MNIVDRLLELFQVKAPAFAELIGTPYATVHSWRSNDRIPVWRHAQIVLAAERAGVSAGDVQAALRQVKRENAA